MSNPDTYSIINISILIITLIVIIVYTIETRKLRKINALQYKLNIDLREPDVIAYFCRGKIQGQILFFVENVGGSSAYKIKAKFDKEFVVVDDIFKANFTINPLFSDFLSDLPAKQNCSWDVGLSFDIYKKYKSNSEFYKYNLTLEFENYKKGKFTKIYHLSIDQFVSKNYFSATTKTEEYLKEISENIKIIASK